MPLIIPYNPRLKKRAAELRKAGILSEVLLWLKVKNKQINGLDFDRQRIIGNYIVDFCCIDTGVVIEIDGSSHDGKENYDFHRDEYIKNMGLEIIRIEDWKIKNKMNDVIDFLSTYPLLQEQIPERKCVFMPDVSI